jgi:pimeloyl-ACP methyl ester carboxylesterase
MPSASRGETLAVDGGHLFYETRGRGETVVLVHGGFGDHRMWNAQWEALSRDFRVARYDHRGFGRSSAPAKPYSAVEDLRRLLDHLGASTAHIVGNSMGGTVAIDFTLVHPGRVSRLVIVASGASGFPVPPEAVADTNKVLETARKQGTKEAAALWLENPMVAVAAGTPRPAISSDRWSWTTTPSS